MFLVVYNFVIHEWYRNTKPRQNINEKKSILFEKRFLKIFLRVFLFENEVCWDLSECAPYSVLHFKINFYRNFPVSICRSCKVYLLIAFFSV